MKVYDVSLTGTTAAEGARSQEAQRAGASGVGASGATGVGSGDHVEFSNTLSSLARAMSAYGADRAAKVHAIAEQYRSGAYRVDSLATGRAMIAEALAGGDQ